MVKCDASGRLPFRWGAAARRLFAHFGDWLKAELRQVRFTYLEAKAEKGDGVAQYKLAVGYDTGLGQPRDQNLAFKWYRSAAFKGVADAQYRLACRYAEGHGVPADDAEALLWLRKAAEQGHLDAQFQLARMYREGRGGPKDLFQANRWFRKAAERGHPEAIHECKTLMPPEPVPAASEPTELEKKELRAA